MAIDSIGPAKVSAALVRDMQVLTVIRMLTGLGLGGCMPCLIATAAGARGATPRGGDIALEFAPPPLVKN